jgi:coenzyme F420-reducing hydrogenase delta subunit
VEHARSLLKEVGIEPERLEMFNLGASDAVLFAKACDEMSQRVRRLGPNPLKRKAEVKAA